ncbi:hypothetical protein H257_15985 [Aphanomyces astaci]|uniref:DDE Tnp4 domain-containing protein n=1 Tax=Aphanomyces astaci TaxID=112090 RepID=W4FLT7_APHAT|nr:hypothetical protein H257_15985 [Aphanomyces astaci]ETV67861.1 hypothetical protein H257_15985 [Aphanomyces astaci]|eukprot:XP_009842606.1 hypothetical protein H257_15985 [Aphanomyces astaci]
MTLDVLKHYNSWEKHAMDFVFRAPTFLKLVLPVAFANYPYAHYATDVNFQRSKLRAGRQGEAIPSFSAKHKMNRLKIEATMSPQGLPVNVSDANRRAMTDLMIMRSCMEQHFQAPKKTNQELNTIDHGEQVHSHPSMWAALVVEGNYVAMVDIQAINLKQNPSRRILDTEDVVRNRRVSSDRVIVENFFS